MDKLQTINRDTQFLGVLKGLAQSYQEISVLRMNAVRESVLSSRTYLESISAVFFDVKTSFGAYLLQLIKKHNTREVARLSLLTQNGKRVHVLLSASSKLHGPITRAVFSQFMAKVANSADDIIIVGKVGKALFEASGCTKKFIFVDVPDRIIRTDDLAPLTYHVSQYEHVFMYYGIFSNVLTQRPMVRNISGDEPYKIERERAEATLYLFEPNSDKILEFFEKQVLILLLGQTIHESELARYSSRITTMETILSNIDRESESLHRKRKSTIRNRHNTKQLEKFSSMTLWKN